MRLEHSLALSRYLHGLLGAQGLGELKAVLGQIEEGPGADGHSRFFHALAGLKGLRLSEGKLKEYDARVMDYEARLAKARGGFAFKYFQYLVLLYTEIFLDRATEGPDQLVHDLNAFLARLKADEISLRDFPPFAGDDLRRLAFFMATGSGKTLLLHANLWQFLHYLEHGKHPEALARRPDGRREFDTILLITPNEGLSRQHLQEFAQSGIDATLLIEDRGPRGLFGFRVKVIEIHKLAEEPSREGVSVLLEELGGVNLVFVDEGHKGTGRAEVVNDCETLSRRI
jgi:type III restriction/modification enzyme restriction subunit